MIPLVFHPIYSQLTLPFKHRFPIDKYQGIRERLAQSSVPDAWFHLPEQVPVEDLKQVLEPGYVEDFVNGSLDAKAMRRIGFPWSKQLVRRTLTAVGGTLLAGRLALQHGIALNLTGGYHHAFANFGSGFCIINDLYLCALQMLQDPAIDRVLIFDLDVHQGDGTAKLAAGHPDVVTVSLHGEKNFPYRKQCSDLDFPLPKGMEDAAYIETVEEALHLALTRFRPDAVIYDAGVDIHVDDDLGLLHISSEGVLARDKLVMAAVAKLGLPMACVIGGGYQRDTHALVSAHMNLFVAAGCCSF